MGYYAFGNFWVCQKKITIYSLFGSPCRRSWMSVRTPWLSWRSPEITEVSWFDFELNWRSTFRWKWLIPRQIPRSSARLLRCRGRLILRCEWSYQTQVRRSISFFSFYTLTLKSYCWADPCPHGANESDTNYLFWEIDINFMLKLNHTFNFAKCWTNQLLERGWLLSHTP